MRIIGRPKHIYSIYKKLVAQKIPLERVYDKVAFRIVVRTVKECYQALGMVHATGHRFPAGSRTGSARRNQTITSRCIPRWLGPLGHFIEIQIRTQEMDRVAQEGVAAHWAYKEGQKITSGDARLFKDLKRLVQSLQEVEDPSEFMESVRGELFEPDVFALTPTGEVRELPEGARRSTLPTPSIPLSAIPASAPRSTARSSNSSMSLQSGDIVEILTQKNQHPRRAWLQLVKTSRARTRIRQYLRREEKERSLKLGREICERELKKYDVNIRGLLKGGHLRLLLKQLNCSHWTIC